MPLWLPPTPPHDEPYVDECCYLLYDTGRPMPADTLTNVIVKKRTKLAQKSGNNEPRHKVPRYDVKAPKSLFSRHISIKKKEKIKQKAAVATSKSLTPSTVLSPVKIERSSSKSPPVSSAPTPDWIINEDWELVQAVEQVLEMPFSLATAMPAHTANWELVADLVNTVSCVYRSAKECKQRFETVVASFDDGKVLTPRKQLKTALKFSIKAKLPKFQQMSSSHLSDNNHQFTTLYSDRFDACKIICGKRNPPKSTSGSGQFQRNPKHTNILQEKCGINYDQPLHPMQVAAARVKRMASQKKSGDHAIASVVQPAGQQVTNGAAQSATIQHIGPAIITSGMSIVGKSPIQGSTPTIHHLAALSQSGTHNVVNPNITRKPAPTPLQGNMAKLQSSKVTGTLLPLSSLPGVEQQFSMQPSLSTQAVSLSFANQSTVVTFTTIPASITNTAVRAPIAYQPARGSAAKLSAVQHIRQAKQTPHTTPAKQQATTLSHQLVLQQHILKQRQITQQQTRQVVSSKALPQKAIYATVPSHSHHVVVCGGTTTVKMSTGTPMQAQMINQLVAQQQQQQRRLSGKTSGSQPPVTLTVTKLLQTTGAGHSAIRHPLLPQSTQISQQTSAAVGSNNISLATTIPQLSQHRQFQLSQIGQSVGTNQSHVTATPTIVASAPVAMQRPPVVAIGNQLPQLRLRNPSSSISTQVAGNQPSDISSLVSEQHSTKES